MGTFIQPSFAKGEFGPALYGRVDTAAYSVAARTLLNGVVHAHGGFSNRAGTKFICPVKDHTNLPVLIDFQFKATDTYIIEMGNLYMRFIRNDAQVLEAADTINAATKADPCVITTSAAHGWSTGDHIYITGVTGMTELNNRFFHVTADSGTTASLRSVYDGGTATIDSSAFGTFSGTASAGKVYEVTTTYAQADLAELKWTQSADTITVTHPTYPVREITRTDHNAWTIADATFAPSIAGPTAVTVAVNGANNNEVWKYKITAVKAETFEESLAGVTATLPNTVSAATNANPVVVTSVAHGLVTGDEVEITGFTEMTEVNDRRFYVTKVDADNFSLDGEDGSGYTAESTGGTSKVFATHDVSGTEAAPTGTAIPDNTITWTAVTGATKYAVYRAKGGSGRYGFLAETTELTYTDDTTALTLTDLDVVPPTYRDPFRIAGEYPGAVGYYQQRRVFGGSTNLPDTSDYSRTGHQDNFSKSDPLQADDAIRATLNARRVNQIRHYIARTDLIVLTDGSEWRVNAGDNSGFAADTLKQEPQTYWGANHLPPIVIGQTILYMQENNIAVRSLGYQLSLDGYTGTDLTLLAPHIFKETTGVSWGYTRSPDPVTHIVLSDGTAAVFTFNQEQEVIAWSRWNTRNGLFKWCAAMRPSSTEVNDAAYFVVERIINSNTVGFIERVHSRRFEDVQDAFFVDSGLSLDTSFAISAATAADPCVITTAVHGLSDGDYIDIEGIDWMPQYTANEVKTNPDQLNGRRYIVADSTATTIDLVNTESPIPITGISETDPMVVTAPAHGLTSGDIIAFNGVAGMTEANNNIYKVSANNNTTDTFEVTNTSGVDIDGTSGFTTYTNGGNVYHGEDGSSFKAYVRNGKIRQAVTSITGLNHLEGESVMILANGNVVTGKSVSAGALTLDERASRVHIGLEYNSDLETLDVEAPDGTIQGKPKKIPKVVVRFEKSRGLLIGPTEDNLVEMKQRDEEKLGEATRLLTGDKEIVIKPSWNSNGRIFLRQNNPLPMTILAVIPDIEVGD